MDRWRTAPFRRLIATAVSSWRTVRFRLPIATVVSSRRKVKILNFRYFDDGLRFDIRSGAH